MPADPRYNRLLIMPFPLRWAARERLKKGLPLFGGFSIASTAGEPSGGSWQAKPPPVPVDATAEAFKLLGLVEATASEAEVKRRYRDLAFEHHPDRGGDVTKFHAVAEAKDRCLKVLKEKIRPQA
jgi:DnaJ-domain-containing protein 1